MAGAKARLPICEHFAAPFDSAQGRLLKSCPVRKLSSMESLRQPETFACHESSNAIALFQHQFIVTGVYSKPYNSRNSYAA